MGFVNHEAAVQFRSKMRGFAGWLADAEGNRLVVDGKDVAMADVRWGEIHGKMALIERYRNSDIMHPSVPKEYRPMVFGSDGNHEHFPTKDSSINLRVPRAMKANLPMSMGACAIHE